MEFLAWAEHNWFVLLQSAGIIGSLLFTAASLRMDHKSRRTENLISITKAHRDIWEKLYRRPELARILDPLADPRTHPLTVEEELFIKLLIFHLNSTHRAAENDLIKLPEGIETDIRRFFSRPLPQCVWPKVKPLLDAEFVVFVEKRI